MSNYRKEIAEYKTVILEVLISDYCMYKSDAQRIIREYNFNEVCRKCNYVALHDDPEYWAESIYRKAKKLNYI